MNRKLLTIALLAVAAAAFAWVFRDSLGPAAERWQTRGMFVAAEAADFDLGPATGSDFPGLHATYRGRPVTLIEEFSGSNGTVLVALRSVDWCPYCRRQVLQLQEYKPFFDAAGIGLVAITYDPPPLQQPFLEEHGVTIPLLSDRDTLSFRTLGILNGDYGPGDAEYGIPHPGMIIVDRDGEVAGKLFVRSPVLRVDSSEALRYAREALGLKAPFAR